MRNSFGKTLCYFSGLVTVLLLFISCQNTSSDNTIPAVKNGVIDLRSYKFNDTRIVQLNGQWAFYWKLWVPPDELKTIDKYTGSPSFIKVPSIWNSHSIVNPPADGKGFATFAVMVLLPADIDAWSIHIKEICSAYTFYINGQKKITVGMPSEAEAFSLGKIRTDVIDFETRTNQLSLVFHVSNYQYSKGGIWDAISIAPEANIDRYRIHKISVSLFLSGTILILGLYHFCLFFIRKKERAYVYFSFFCILMSLRIIVIEERLIMSYFPGLSLDMLFNLEYLTFYLGASAFYAYFINLFPKDFSRQVHKIFQIIIFSFSFLVILLPAFYYSQTLKAFQIFAILSILYAVSVLFRAFKNNRFGIKTFLFGLLFFFGTVINDILAVMRLIDSVVLFHLGSFVFILCQAVILIKKYSRAFQTIEKQEKSLNKRNDELLDELRNRKQVEYALKLSEEKYRELVENLNEVIYSVDTQGFLTYISPQIEQILGYSSKAMIGSHFSTYIHPDDLSAVNQSFQDIKSNHLYPSEYRIRSKAGDYRWVRTFSRISKAGDSDSIQGVLIDITDNKLNEEALKKSEDRFKSIFENANDGILIVDSNQKIVQCNKKMSTLLGYSENEILSLSITDIHPREHFDFIVEQVNKMVNREISLITNIPVLKKNGEKFFVDISSSLIELEGNTYVMGLFRDVSELKEAQDARQELENQLLQAQKMQAIGTLAGGVAHDFNNILSPIIGHSELLLLDLEENSSSKESVKEIYGSALRAKELVHQILTFSRQEKDETKLIKIQPILNEVIKMIRATLPTTIDISSEIDPDCGAINANPTQIHQLIMNILTNAYHAIGDAVGEIKIRLSAAQLNESDLPREGMQPGEYNCLLISDTGAGMDAATQQRIFEPFFTTKKKGKGTGMGLAVVHGIVENMKGYIHVESAPDKGTEFKFYLPVAKTSFTHIEAKDNKTLAGGNETILFVDDEKEIIRMNQKFLERIGYQVDSYDDALEALKNFKIDREKFDLVITDFAMPRITGDKFASEIKKLRPDIPVILSTGYSESVTPGSVQKYGIERILQKPIIIKELSKVIREVLDKKDASARPEATDSITSTQHTEN